MKYLFLLLFFPLSAFANFSLDRSIEDKILSQGVPKASLEQILDWMNGKYGTRFTQRVYSCKGREITNLKPCEEDDRSYYTKEVSITPHRYAISIDFSQPSNKPRLYLIDLKTGEVEISLVTHGKGSGELYATTFSNIVGSGSTSLGMYKVGERYKGSHGFTLRLYGLERSNDAAYERDVVMHGADYADERFFQRIDRKTGNPFVRLGLSQGCPAVSPKLMKKYLPLMENGGLIHHYYPSNGR